MRRAAPRLVLAFALAALGAGTAAAQNLTTDPALPGVKIPPRGIVYGPVDEPAAPYAPPARARSAFCDLPLADRIDRDGLTVRTFDDGRGRLAVKPRGAGLSLRLTVTLGPRGDHAPAPRNGC
jgi:hypothetical protein